MGKDNINPNTKRRAQLGEDEQAFLLWGSGIGDRGLGIGDRGLDWEALTRRLVSDGLAPMVYKKLGDNPAGIPADIPSATLTKLKQNYYQNASVNHIRLEELRRIGQSLAPQGIKLLVLKGGALATTVYADPAFRFMGDLDVAVPPIHAATALRQLQTDGYTLHGDISDLDDPALLREKGWHLRLTRQVWGKQMELEFHWPMREQVLVSQAATLDIQALWKTAVPLDEKHNLWQPSPAFMLLHLCIHTGLQHRFNDLGVRHYVDIDRMVRCWQDDPKFWAGFFSEAKKAKASHTCYLTLEWSKRLLGTPLPDLTAITPPEWKRTLFARHINQHVLINRQRVLYDRRRWVWRLVASERVVDLVLEPMRSLFPGRDYIASYYQIKSPSKIIGYALWHPVHALTRALKHRLT